MTCVACGRHIAWWDRYGFWLGHTFAFHWHYRDCAPREQLLGHITRTGFRRARRTP